MVEQMINDNGNFADNQLIIKTDNAIFFRSYYTICAKYDRERNIVFLNKDYFKDNLDGHKTTLKHLYMFLRDYTNYRADDKKSVLKRISEGVFKLVPQSELKFYCVSSIDEIKNLLRRLEIEESLS